MQLLHTIFSSKKLQQRITYLYQDLDKCEHLGDKSEYTIYKFFEYTLFLVINQPVSIFVCEENIP